jgi:hypothetical protein
MWAELQLARDYSLLGGESILKIKSTISTRHWWLTPVILATQKAEIRRIMVQSQP